ncbi:LuxR C-terminal-related transcriptional regulator [Kribbella sp. NPDC051620]|uniref:LuxR C-terminal-related transcriptional regulator n=1 Tax=Kribbella sp. NPDC051620 TaxID=3364120 RepID=UPI0037A55842
MLLEGKFRLPRRRVGVSRGRLGERLEGATRLAVVSAPAGFGKTALVSEWLGAAGRRGAWLSLDERDNDSASYWSYLVAALRTAAPDVGAAALSLLQASEPPVEAVLSTLLNDLEAVEYDVVLVLDDYHVIERPEIHDGMAFLVEQLPPRIRLVIASRVDPPFPLARMRARGELVEIRSAELRFTAGEVAAYLNGVMGLALTAHDVAKLEARTEGWIAALQLAALSMQGRDDVSGFIAGFAGNDRHIVDYLAEEVLQRQPEEVQHFLLQTSILDRLSGPLCDAVTGQGGGKDRLAAIERGNLFLFPLDDQRRWYRYHQLFADVLQAHLLDQQPDAVRSLHQRASAWYEANGERAEAIRHSLAAKDFEQAATLIELAIPALRRTRQEAVALTWLQALPDEVLSVRPVLSVSYAGTLLITHDPAGVDRRLEDAQRHLQPTAETIVVDHNEYAHLPEAIETYRAAQSIAQGNLSATVTHARQALAIAADDSHLWRAASAGLLGLAYWATGDLEAAHEAWTACTTGLQASGYTADALGCAIALADIRSAQGRPTDAMRTFEQALNLNPTPGDPVLRGSADMYVGLSELHLDRNDPQTATQYLAKAHDLGDHLGLPQYSYRRRVAMARIREAEGDYQAALELLDEAETVYVSDYFPNVRPIPAVRARVWLAAGKLDKAIAWAGDQGLTVDDDLSYLREYEHLTLARVLTAQGIPIDAFLDRLQQAAEDGNRARSVNEIRALRAQSARTARATPGTTARATPGSTLKQGLVEPLSAREFDVLRLLGTDLDGPGIARELIVSLNTVRTHTKHIYAKLGVTNRRAAVRRATELELFSR